MQLHADGGHAGFQGLGHFLVAEACFKFQFHNLPLLQGQARDQIPKAPSFLGHHGAFVGRRIIAGPLVILDEADEMLSRGFKDQIYDVFKFMPQKVQVCLFSATMPGDVHDITKHFMRDPVRILVKKDELTLEVTLSSKAASRLLSSA